MTMLVMMKRRRCEHKEGGGAAGHHHQSGNVTNVTSDDISISTKHQQPQRKKARRRLRHVSWANTLVETQQHEQQPCFADEIEGSLIWYSRKDYDDFLQDRIQTVRMLRGLSPKTTAAYQDFCIRGLEPYQNEIRHATNREVHQSTILGEQTRQHQLNIRDEDIYRALVSMRSNLALQKAQQQALMDEYEVRHDPVGGVGGATFRALTRRHSMMSGGATSATALLGGSIVSSNPAALLPTPQTGAAVTVAGKTPKVDLGAADQISTLIRQRRHSMSQVQSSSSSSSSSSQLSTAPINDDDATSTSTNTTRPAATRRLSCQMSSSAAIRELQERNARRLMDMYQHAEQPNCLYSRFPIRRDSLFGNAQPTSSFAVATSASNATRRLLAMHHRRDSLNMMQQQQQRQPNDSVFPERAVVSNTGGTAASMS